jgi:hypothetical protein
MSAIGLFPSPIRRYLSDFVAKSRRIRVVRAGLIALGFVLAWTLLIGLIDRFTALSTWIRAIFLLVEGTGVVAIMTAPIRAALRRRVDWVEASQQIERHNSTLGQRLVTITSQLLAPAGYRGSAQMLDALVGQVSGEISSFRAGHLVGWRAIIRPALLALALLALFAALWSFSWLNLPQLIARQIRPLSSISPVSTTQIDVTPTNARVAEHAALPIKAVIHRLGDGSAPTLYVSADDKQWDVTPMTPTIENTYIYTLPSVEQDVQFYIKAGDATTETFWVRVLRRPAVAEFRIRYTYPPYTGRIALSVNNTDGLIEAPQGSDAVVSVVATEPLASAALKIGGKRIQMAATAEPNIRQVSLTISRDERCELEMTSDRGVEWHGPQTMQIRSVPDRPPLVRLLQPATDLRLSPREIVPMAYQALDDYGVAQLSARAQVNANPPIEYSLLTRGDPRRIEGSFDLDLVPLKLKVGDVVSIAVDAIDKAGQKGTSDVRHILISPRSIDVATHQRLAELSQAAEYARDWADELGKAQQSLEQARRPEGDRHLEQSAALARTGRLLATAEEAGAMVRQSLLRAIMYSASPTMSDALAVAVDGTALRLDEAARVDDATAARRAVDDPSVARMVRAAGGARELASQIKQLADGDQAAAVLADRTNLKAAPSTAPTDRAAQERRKQMFDRAAQDMGVALKGLGINPKDGNIDAQLQQRIDAAAHLIAVARPIDLTPVAQRWAAAVRANDAQPPRLDERLAAASQAEAVRPDAELISARDLQVASRAAAALAESEALYAAGEDSGQKKKLAEALDAYPAALAALRAEQDENRRAMRAPTPAAARQIYDAAKAIHIAAAAARAKMLLWASTPGPTADDVAGKTRETEDLALSANAATQTKHFEEAAEIDKKLAVKLGRPEIADASAAPKAIDNLSQNQEQLADQTDAADDKQAAAIADVQKDVADAIDRTRADPAGAAQAADSAETRQKATAAISSAQEKLASLPMQLMTAQQAASDLADASKRLAAAQAELAAATPDQRETASRMLGMVQSEVDDARKSFEAAAKPLHAALADELTESLRPFAPDTSNAVSSVDEQLKGALTDLQQSLAQEAEGGDRSAVEQASSQARDAIARAQDALRDAQAKVIERDPLVSARWFARAAADALSAAPPNKRTAAAHQKKTLEALNRAAVDALRRSKNTRLSQVPAYAPFYLPQLPGEWADSDRLSGDRLLQTIPGLREWGRLRERTGEALDAPLRESEPPGYSDALRTYFEVLGREDSKPRDGKP